MIAFDGTAQAAIDAGARSPCYLVEMDFASGMQRFSTWSAPFTVGGNTFQPVGGNILRVSQIKESEDSRPDVLEFEFSLVNSAMLAACIGASSEWRRKPVRVYLQMLTGNGAIAGARVLRWQGTIDGVEVSRDQPSSPLENGLGSVKLKCYRSGMANLRKFSGRRVTAAQQKARFSGDKGLDYIQPLIELPAPWLTIEFQKV